jgi:hypothetical protein
MCTVCRPSSVHTTDPYASFVHVTFRCRNSNARMMLKPTPTRIATTSHTRTPRRSIFSAAFLASAFGTALASNSTRFSVPHNRSGGAMFCGGQYVTRDRR